MREEKENSQQAFDRYRERARLSLLKTAAEQQAAESKIAVVQEQLQVRDFLYLHRFFYTVKKITLRYRN